MLMDHADDGCCHEHAEPRTPPAANPAVRPGTLPTCGAAARPGGLQAPLASGEVLKMWATVRETHLLMRVRSGVFCERCCPACHPRA
jgi:hypothetical protein